MAAYDKLFETTETLFPDVEKREKLLLANGMTCFLPYVSRKTGYIMKAMRFLQKLRNDAIFACMCEIRDLCDEAEIPYVFLKGLCLAAQIYDPPETRKVEDVDILVAEKDCRQLIQNCLDVGFSFKGDIHNDVNAPYLRIQNGHMHAEVLYKEYDTGSGRISIPLEIHVSPNERCYEMYGRILESNGYTEELLARACPITIQMPGETEETFMIPGTEDNFYIQSLHMIMHLGLDQVLYLFVDKPWQSQSVLKQALDLVLFAEKERPDWKAIEKLATENDHLEEYICVVGILNRIWGTDIPIEERKKVEDSVYNRPIDLVCRILDRIDIQTIMGNDASLKKAVDHEICQWIRRQKDSLPEGMQVSRSEDSVMLSVNTETTKTGRYALTLYVATDDNEWKIWDYLIELSEKELVLYQSNGYHMIWDPETYGKVLLSQATTFFSNKEFNRSLRQGKNIYELNEYLTENQTNRLVVIDHYSISYMPFHTRFLELI